MISWLKNIQWYLKSMKKSNGIIIWRNESFRKKETENELKDLLESDPEFIKNLYDGDCYYHNQGQEAFCDELLLSRPVQTILMSWLGVKIRLSFVGGYTEEIINFPNGMCVKIDFGNSKLSFFYYFF